MFVLVLVCLVWVAFVGLGHFVRFVRFLFGSFYFLFFIICTFSLFPCKDPAGLLVSVGLPHCAAAITSHVAFDGYTVLFFFVCSL